MPSPREDELLRALDESKKALSEVVEECVFVESELARQKKLVQDLQLELQELRDRSLSNTGGGGGDSTAAARSLKLMMQEQQELFARERARLEAELAALGGAPPQDNTNNVLVVSVNRVAQLERVAGEERAKREELLGQLTAVEKERDALKLDLQAYRTENYVSREEIETERDQRKAMRDEFERMQRNSEASAREQRASERRYEALMDEMRQVMHERDEAVSQRDEARFHASELERAAQAYKLDADEARSERDGLVDRVMTAERARDLALAQKDSEERLRATALADLETVKQQVGTLVVERDSALRENEWVMKRLDAVQAERRELAQERSRTAERVDELQRQYEALESRTKVDARRLQEAEATNADLQGEADKLRRDVSELSAAAVRSRAMAEDAEEHKQQAEREIEAARRQVKALNEEMMTVLKARDLAQRQRDEFSNELTRTRAQMAVTAASVPSTAALLEDAAELAHARRELTLARQLIGELQAQVVAAQAAATPPQPPPPSSLLSSSTATVAAVGMVVVELRSVLRGTIAELQMDVFSANAPSPPRLPSAMGSAATRGLPLEALEGQVTASLMEARDVATRVGALRDKLRTALEGERSAARRVEQLEWKLVRQVDTPGMGGGGGGSNSSTELQRLRQRALDLEKELAQARAAASPMKPGPSSVGLDARVRSSTVLENENVLLRQEVRAKTTEVEALKEQREVLYREVEALNLKLQRATPHKGEVDGLRSRLRAALTDLDRAEEELRRLRVS